MPQPATRRDKVLSSSSRVNARDYKGVKLESLERRQLLANAAGAALAGSADYIANNAETGYVQPGSFLYKSGGYLTGKADGAPLTIAMNWLKANAGALGLQKADVVNSVVDYQYTDADSGQTHIYLKQTYNGLTVSNSDMSVTVMRDGRILSVGGTFVPGLGSRAPEPIAPGLSVTAGLKKAAADLGLKLTREPTIETAARGTGQISALSASQVSTDLIPAQLQYVATSGGVKLAWNYVLNVPGGQHWYNTNVNGTSGALLWTVDYVDSFVKAGTPLPFGNGSGAAGNQQPTLNGTPPPTTIYNATYDVYARPNQSPSTGPRTLENNPWDSGPSPFGWQDTDGDTGAESNLSAGNNVSAQEDRDNNNTGGIQANGGTLNGDGSGNLTFDFPIDFTQEPTTPNNQLAAITNLYYWNNILHDVHYRYGFTEAARNFQQNNYGNGGIGNDRVQADAQDGSGTNNANFGTPPDGSSGRMQMYLFTSPTPDRDGDLDAQVMIHEFGHGVSNRLTGNANGLNALQSGGMGEGWGDWWSLMLLQTDGSTTAQDAAYPVGTYVLNQPLNGPGIRRQPYSNNMAINTQTLNDYASSTGDVHAIGELWVDALWDANWNLIRKYGFDPSVQTGYGPGDSPAGKGNKLMLRLVMDALKLQPLNPSLFQARDAILAADQALNGGADLKELWRAFARRGYGVNASTASSNSTSVTPNFDVPAALFDPFVSSVTPSGTVSNPNLTTVSFSFDEPMDPTSFSIADDLGSFAGPGGADLKSQVTGFTWTNSNKTLNIAFPAQTTDGAYSMTIGPNILAADNGHAMDQNQDDNPGQPNDTFTTNFTLDRFPGPDAGGYEASPTSFQNIDLVAGQPGVSVVVNGTDDGNGTIALPAGNTFTLYGTTYTNSSVISVSANGFIAFGGTATTNATNTNMTSLPATAAIAPAWDDWRTDTNAGANDSAVLWKINGNDLIVEWSDVPQFDVGGTNGATFQAILKLNTTGGRNGDIIFNYPDLFVGNAAYNDGASQSTGIKATGTQPNNLSGMRLLISQNRSDTGVFVGTGKAIRITATSASGQVFADDNGNGTLDAGEAAVPGAHLYVDANNNGVLDIGENATFADNSGNYTFTSLTDGDNVIRIDSPTYVNTQPNPTVTLAMGEHGTGKNIGVFNTALVGTPGSDILTINANGNRIEIDRDASNPPTYSILASVLTKLSWDGQGGGDQVAINAGPSLKLIGNEDMNSLAIGDNGSAFMPAGTNSVLVARSLNFAPGAKLDLGDNDMIVDYTGSSELANVQALINSARHNGAWDGTGITSSSAAANATHNTTLGAMEATDYTGGTFDGQSLDSTAVLIKYTYYGDTDFNGRVNFDDYVHTDAGFNNHRSGWANGDFDGNGLVNFDDYVLIDLAFNTQTTVL